MIEKFNFFDVYVYLLPGIAFVGLIWLPFGIVAGKWPPADWSSALLLLAAAYIVGHVLYYPAKRALLTATPRYPSDRFLDVSGGDEKFKTALAATINARFKGAVEVDVKAADEQQSAERNLAFFLCRSALVTGKAASYGEQFEGLYQFLRALTLVFLLAAVFHLGWALALLNKVPEIGGLAEEVAFVAIVFAVVATLVDHDGQQSAWFLIVMLAIASFACPHFLKGYLAIKAEGPSKVPLLVGLCLLDALAFSRCLGAYQPLAWEFATAIYRDFYTSTTGQRNGGDGASPS
jgi:hypothetical protein